MSKDTVQGNKLIAEFMGFDWQNKTKSVHDEDSEVINRYVELPLTEADLTYHEDWNELMAVVEKIESSGLFQCVIKLQWVKIQQYDPFNTRDIAITGIPPYSKIEAVWQAVVQFIKWHKPKKQ